MKKFPLSVIRITFAFLAVISVSGFAMATVFESDVPQDIQTRTTTDLGFIATVKGSDATPLHKSVFGAVDGANYTTWFTTRVTSIGFDKDDDSGAIAYVAPYDDAHKMMMTRYFTQADIPQIGRLMVMFHESRHTEEASGFWPHATCPTPFQDAKGQDIKSIWSGLPLAGKPGCDSVAIGAYGSSAIMIKNVSKFCTNCTDKVRMDAGIYSDDQVNRLIDKTAHDQLINDFASTH